MRCKQRRQHFWVSTGKDLTDRLATGVRGRGATTPPEGEAGNAPDAPPGRTLPPTPAALPLAGRGRGEVGGSREPPAPVGIGVRGGAGEADAENEEDEEPDETTTVSACVCARVRGRFACVLPAELTAGRFEAESFAFPFPFGGMAERVR